MLHDWTTLKKLVWLNCRNGEKTLGPASIVSFIGRASSEITALTAAITPVQSFNGYDHPWPGGGGKNLFDVSTCTLGKYIGATGSIGTLEAAMYSALIPVVIGDSYTYSYNLTGTGSNTRIHGYDENGNWLQQIATGSNSGQITVSFAIPDGVRYVRISTTKPEWTGAKDHQFEKSSTKTAYAPYSNICPIAGFTGANIYRYGKNPFNKTGVVAGAGVSVTQLTDGFNVTTASNGTYRSAYGGFATEILPDNTTVTLSAHYKKNAGKAQIGFRRIDNNLFTASASGADSEGDLKVTYTVTKATPVYLSFLCTSSTSEAGNVDYTNVQVEFGSEATTYEAYSGNVYTFDWTSAAGTVYAGSYEAVSGKLKARPQYASYNGETLVGPWLSSMDVYAEGVTPTTGAQVVDLGGTETEYTLTPQQVASLVGQNYIWADTGDVTVTVKL